MKYFKEIIKSPYSARKLR